jgi:PAS domain S-box-containing protein
MLDAAATSPVLPSSRPEQRQGFADQFIAHTADGVWHLDASAKIVHANRWAAEMLDCSIDELVGSNGFDFLQPGQAERARAAWARRMAGQAESSEWELRRKDGRTLWCRASSVPLHDGTGATVGAIVLFTDLTKQKQLEAELRERESLQRRQAQMLELAGDVVIVRDLQDRILFWNGGAERTYGYPKAVAVGRVVHELLRTEFPVPKAAIVAHVLHTGSWSGELTQRRSDGTALIVDSHWAMQRDEVGQPLAILQICRDITPRKQLESELQQREALLRAALLVSRAGTYAWDTQTGEATWDDSLRVLFGLNEGETVRSYSEFLQRVHPEDRSRVHAECERVMAQRCDLAIEYRILTPAGVRWINARGKAPDGDSHVMVGACIDVTEQALAERALRNSKERLVAALAASNTGTFVWDIRTNSLEWDAELNRLFGLTGEQTAGALLDFVALVHPDDRARVIAACERCRNEGANFHEEFRIPLPDGSLRWLEDKGKTFFGADGRPAYMTGACVDITARKNAEQASALNRERFELVREASGVGFWFCDLPHRKLEWDARVKAHFGLPPEAGVTFDEFYALLHPDDRERTREAVERSISSKGVYDVEYRTVGRDGITRWIRAIGTTRYDPDGQPFRFDGITIDISENVRVRRLLESRREELEWTVAERTASLSNTVAELEKFSYSISHDLRAPLRAMQSFALILQEECAAALPADGQDYLRRIIVAAQRMDRLIQDVLSYSRLARGDVVLQPVDLRRLIVGIVETYPHFHDALGAIQVAGTLPVVRGNEAALTQCISNLLGNALKFRRPDVTLEIKIWCETTSTGTRLLVRDNGIGIRPENQERIFALFEQVNPDAGGTGIGLAIVRKAAEKMGARVGVHSDYGVGSTFWIEFPASNEAS